MAHDVSLLIYCRSSWHEQQLIVTTKQHVKKYQQETIHSCFHNLVSVRLFRFSNYLDQSAIKVRLFNNVSRHGNHHLLIGSLPEPFANIPSADTMGVHISILHWSVACHLPARLFSGMYCMRGISSFWVDRVCMLWQCNNTTQLKRHRFLTVWCL